MRKFNVYAVILSLVVGFMFISCSKDEVVTPPAPPELDEIDEFIWTGLHNYYLWYSNVPNLATSKTEKELIDLAKPYSNHEDFFESLLYERGTVDKWSWIVDDYEELENYFSGISTSMGWDLRLIRWGHPNYTNVTAVVNYVVPGSPADLEEIKRGDVIYSINGQVPTMSTYSNLFFNTESMTIVLGSFAGTEVNPLSGSKSLTAVEINENPIHLTKIFENVAGKRVGYLVYNSFTYDYNEDLRDVFHTTFPGIDELIIDLRYNGGGSISSAIYLASMIYTTNTNTILIKSQYNDKYEAFLKGKYGSSVVYDYFANSMTFRDDENKDPLPLNSLNLSKVYFLTSSGSASASEMIVNGLKPYIDVIMVGDTTRGKYYGSSTIYDYIDNQGTKNPNHKWAMQPLIMQFENANGETYPGGLKPAIDLIYEEGFRNLFPLGDENEPQLKMALDHIRGIPMQAMLKSDVFNKLKVIGDSKDYKPLGKEMYKRDYLRFK